MSDVSSIPLIFDGHNDTVLSLTGRGFQRDTDGRSFFERSEAGHIDLPRAKAGGLGGGFFAVLIRNQTLPSSASEPGDTAVAIYDPETGWPPAMPLDYAQSTALDLLGFLYRMERESDGRCKVIRSAAELQHCLDNGIFAILLHFEGADPIDPDGHALEVFSQAGVRSLGITHFRRNRYAEGVPLLFPSSPDTGPGLSDEGKNLVRMCNQLRILVDVSHMTEKGFWDVAAITDAPIVATHSNAWTLSNAPRNLTDKQLDAIKEGNGVAGLNFHVAFLRSDGSRESNVPLSVMADHIAYMADRMGIDCVALGSDFDGAIMPDDLRDAAGLPRLMQELTNRGFDDEALTKIAHGNWVRVLRDTWGN